MSDPFTTVIQILGYTRITWRICGICIFLLSITLEYDKLSQNIEAYSNKHYIISHDFVGQDFWQGSAGWFFCSMWTSGVTHWFLAGGWSQPGGSKTAPPSCLANWMNVNLVQLGPSRSPCSHSISPRGPGLPETKPRPGTGIASPHCSEQPWPDFKGRRNRPYLSMGEMSKNLWPSFIYYNANARVLLPEILI